MQVLPIQVMKYGFDTTVTYWMKYRNIKDFKLNGSSFIYELKLRKTKKSRYRLPRNSSINYGR
jgi:hypothetical protein